MRSLANENVPGLLVEALAERGHDAAWIRRDSPGAKDSDILRRSVAEDRVLVSFDKDFGELVYLSGARASCGVVLIRLAASSPESLTARCVAALESRDDWRGHFSVIEPGRIRMATLR
jgi:predicted nuclease of predicted toxin-antitoxin system